MILFGQKGEAIKMRIEEETDFMSEEYKLLRSLQESCGGDKESIRLIKKVEKGLLKSKSPSDLRKLYGELMNNKGEDVLKVVDPLSVCIQEYGIENYGMEWEMG